MSNPDTKRRWTAEEVAYIKANATTASIRDMAARLGRSELSVQLYMLRHDIARHQQVKRNLLRELIAVKIDTAYFHPTKEFYKAIGINQVRFQQIWQGYRQATNKEMEAVAKHLKFTSDELMKFMFNRQLNLFDNN